MKRELTWNEKQRRWFKKIPVTLQDKFGKKQFIISQRDCGLTDKQWTEEKSYSTALAFWIDAKKKVEAEPVEIVPTLVRLPTGEVVPISKADSLLKSASQLVDWGKVDAIGKVQLLNLIQGNQDAIKTPAKADQDRSIKTHVEAFRTKGRNDVADASIMPGRFVKLSNSLDWLLKFIDENKIETIDEINSDFLERFFGWLTRQHKVLKVLACASVRDHLQVFKNWTEWLFEKELINLPRNFKNKKFHFKCPNVNYRYWTRAEFQTVYKTNNDRLRLYLLLVANCGFYSSDIANIKKSELNLKAGTITRQRQKTGDDLDLDKYLPSSNVPLVTFQLWPETLKLLKAYLSNDPVFALVNEDGGALWKDGVYPEGTFKNGKDVSGKYWKTDNIRSIYSRFNATNGIKDAPTFEMIRKTSAQWISESDHKKCVSLFLGHAERTTDKKHYTTVTNEEFKACLEWLRTEYL